MTRWFYASLALTVVTAAGSVALWAAGMHLLPADVPTHWGLDMQPDGWTPRDQLWLPLALVPGGMLLVAGLTALLPWMSPRNFRVEPFRPTFEYVMFLVVALCAFVQALTLTCAVYGVDPGRGLVAGVFLFLALVGNVLGKLKRNFWAGVRTPWTLASEVVWERTHRLAAWLFVGAGVVGAVAALAGVPGGLCFLLVLAAALVPVVYSFVIYKRLERQGKLEAPQS